MAARRDSLAATLATIAEHAPTLRKAGVLELDVHGLLVKLAPHAEPAPTEDKKAAESDWGMDPLNDPATYVGGRVPGFTREES